MRKHFRASAVAVAALVVYANALLVAQDKPVFPPQQQPTKAGEVAMQVQVVVSRYLNEKRVSSLPYTLSMMSGQGRANLRLNSEMPVPSTVFTPVADGQPERVAPLTSYTMRPAGTNIDIQVLQATSVAEGRYVLNVTVSETWFQPADSVAAGAKSLPPISRNYQSQNTVQMKDGETAQFTAATDRTTGEVIRVEVTLKILK
jgi:hypothetical protein